MKTALYILIMLFVFTISGCKSDTQCGIVNIATADVNADLQVKKLLYNIKCYQDSVIVFGSEEGFAVKNVFGDYPGVFVWNFSKDFMREKEFYKSEIIKAYSLGAVVMLDFSDFFNYAGKQNVLNSYNSVANFVGSLKYNNNAIPLALKFFPCKNGDGYWWDRGVLPENDYKKLWLDGIQTLSGNLGLHNILYVYSPYAGLSGVPYMYGFPGENFVDIMGMDVHFTSKDTSQYANYLAIKTDTLVNMAAQINKPAAITGTSLKNSNMTSWLCNTIVPAISQYDNNKIAWLTISNGKTAKNDITSDTVNFLDDIAKFKLSQLTVFLDDLPNLYNGKLN